MNKFKKYTLIEYLRFSPNSKISSSLTTHIITINKIQPYFYIRKISCMRFTNDSYSKDKSVSNYYTINSYE